MRRLSLFVLAVLLGAVPAVASAQSTLPVPTGDDDAAVESAEKELLQGQQGWLGVSLKLSSEADAKALGYAQPLIKVEMVFADSPADASGFQAGDYIVAFEGDPLYDVGELVKRVKATKPGSQVTFKRIRGTSKKDMVEEDVPLLLGVRPDAYQMLVDHFVDKPGPELDAVDQVAGSAVKLADHEGKVVVLDFWATWCVPCRKAMPHLAKLHEEHADDGLVIVGVSAEESGELAAFLEDNPQPYTIARDNDRASTSAYMVNAFPTLYVLDRKGVVRNVFIGASKFDEIDEAIETLLAE